MKKRLKILLIVLLCIALAAGSTAAWQFAGNTFTDARTLTRAFGASQTLIAHRGYSAKYPQNTVPAFTAAAQAGFDGFEFDIHTAKDGIWVVMHNDTVDEMTDGEGRIADCTYEELQKLTVDAGNGIERYPELNIPTLEDALSVCDAYDIFPVIEVKSCIEPLLLQDILGAIYAHDLEDRAVIISYNIDYLETLRALDPDIRMMYLSKELTLEEADRCAALGLGADVFFVNFAKMSGALKYAQSLGLEIGAWTVDFPIVADFMHLQGIDIITTNRITHK